MFSRPVAAVRAIDGVSFTLNRGELGLVGESGCGPPPGRILRLERPTSGRIVFEGVDLATLGEAELRAVRRRVQVIFQDPYSSLNPRMTIGQILAEPLKVHGIVAPWHARRACRSCSSRWAAAHAQRYPHQLSGGQRQRVGIARALAMEPSLIICDEPVSALDVSIQAQIINLLEDLQSRLGLTYLFIAHDLSVVRHISDRVAVMYLGKIVEIADRTALYEEPLHPYARSSPPCRFPTRGRGRARAHRACAASAQPAQPAPGCVFHPRCPIAVARCSAEVPALRELRRALRRLPSRLTALSLA